MTRVSIVAAIALVAAAQTAVAVETFFYHDCGCEGTGSCASLDNVVSGACQNVGAFITPTVTSQKITCQPDIRTCATLFIHNDAMCSTFGGVIMPVCNTCQKLGDPSLAKNGVLSMYAYIACNPTTEAVTATTECNSDCSACTGGNHTHNLDMCVPAAARVNTYLLNQGLSPCPAVRVQQWEGSSNCDSNTAPAVDRLVAQNYCSGQGLFKCSNQPSLPAETGPNVLVTTCAMGCNEGCTYRTVNSGSCAPIPSPSSQQLYSTATCDTDIGTCANIAIFENMNCSGNAFVYSAKCGSCAKGNWGAKAYHMINCYANGSVTIADCDDSLCQQGCTVTNPRRDLFQCVPSRPLEWNWNSGLPQVPGAINFGIVPCDTVTEKVYLDSACATTPIRRVDVNQGMCAGNVKMTCGTFALQSVTMTDCQCHSDGTPCGVQKVTPSGSCTVPTNRSGGSIPGESFSLTCDPNPRTCARAVVWNNTNCQGPPVFIAQPVCDMCDYTPRLGYMKINCNGGINTSFSYNCDSSCNNCKFANVKSATAMSEKCVTTILGEMSFVLQSITNCDAITITSWNTSSTCAGSPMSMFHRSAGQCAYGASLQCGAAPDLPGPANNYVGTGPLQVIETVCDKTYCGGNCNQTVYDSNVCTIDLNRASATFAPMPNATVTAAPLAVMSRQLTCGGSQYCADEILFAGTTCEHSTFLAIATSVCNACNFRNGTYYRLRCDPNSDNVWWDLGCNADCSMCTQPMLAFRPVDQCSPGLRSGIMAVNKGVYRCETVQIVEYGAPTCASSSVLLNYSAPLGQCQFGETLSCGKFNLPLTTGGTNVTQTPCGWCGASCPAVKTFPSNACQQLPYVAPRDPTFPPIQSMIVGCPSQSYKCARFAFFGNTSCSHFHGVFDFVCGSCVALPEGGFGNVVCDEQNMEVTIYLGCNADCSTCSNPRPHVSQLAECSVAEFGTFGKKLLTIAVCDALIKVDYANTDCTGMHAFSGAISQGSCSPLNMSLSCANAAGLTFSGSNLEVLSTQCGGDKWCANNCVATVHASGSCVVQTDTNGVNSKKYSCDTTSGSQCVDFGIYNTSTCDFRGQWYPRSIKCGTCLQDANLRTNVKVTCNAAAGTVTIMSGCDGNCANCNSVSTKTLNADALQCSGSISDAGGWSIASFAVKPCATITVQQFTSQDCSGTAQTTNQVSDGDCGPQGRLQCGNNYAATFDTNSNMDNVTFYECGVNSPPQQHSHSIFPSGTCQPNLLASVGYKSTRATCSTSRGYCTDLMLWKDSACTQFGDIVNAACGSCIVSGLHYFRVDCTSSSVFPTAASCSDSACTRCNASVTIPLDACTTILGQPMQSKGVIPCRTVYVEQFINSNNCSGTAEVSRTIAQSWCDLHGVFTCTNQKYEPFPTPPSTQNVLIQTCAPGTACSQDCGYSTVPSGGCSSTDFGGLKPTCNAKQSMCATMGVFYGPTCTAFVNLLSVGCDQCQFLPALGYYSYVRCDVVTNAVYFSAECDSQCNTCGKLNFAVREQFACSQGIPINNAWVAVSNMYVVNFGVHSCDTVSTEIYSSGSCAPSTKIGQMEFEMGRCDSERVFLCGDYQLQSVTRTRCNCGTNCGSNYARENDTFAAGTGCLKQTGNFSVSATCSSMPATCANLAIFSDANCNSFQWQSSAVCGTCFLYDGIHMKVGCDASRQQVQLFHCADSTCSNCNTLLGIHPVNNCSNGLIGTHSVFNLGLNPCDAITVTSYNSSNCDPSTMANYVTRAQGECAWGDSFTCENAPYLNNQAATQGATQVMLTSCPAGSKNGQFCMSTDCKMTIRESGVCFEGTANARWPANSSRYTCGGGGTCATFLLFEQSGSAQCSGTPSTTHTAVCGSCFHFNGLWNRLHCDLQTGDATFLHQCDANCNNCNLTASSPRPPHQCVAGHHADSWVLNRAMFPCTTVNVQAFAGDACEPSTVMFNFTESAAHCNMGDTYHCGSFNLPSQTSATSAVVTEAVCRCQAGSTCPPLRTYNETTCQASTIFGMGNMTMSVTCNPKPDYCVSVHAFGSPTCASEWHGMNTLACGTCMKGGDGSHYRIDCSFESQTATVRMACDATCSSCAPLSYARTFSAFQCQPGLEPNAYLQITGIAMCATATYMAFPNAGCAGPPVFMQSVGQGQCTVENIDVTCSNAPALVPVGGFSQVLETFCPHTSDGLRVCHGTQCQTSVYNTAQCYPFTHHGGRPRPANFPQMYHKTSCGAVPAKCVDLGFFNNSNTCQGPAFTGLMTLACGSCMFNTYAGFYLNAVCNADRSVTMKNCTDPLCQQCAGDNLHLNLQPEACSFDEIFARLAPARLQANTQMYLRYTQVHDCVAATVDVYTSSDCSGTATAQFVHGSGGCNGGFEIRCGNNFDPNAISPTAAPYPADASIFTLVLKAPFVSQTFAIALGTVVSGATLQDVQMTVSPNGTVVSFFFIGPQAADFQFILARSIVNDAAQTAALLGASSVTSQAAPTNSPNGPPTNGGAPESKADTAQTVEIVVGVLAGLGLLIVLALVLRSRANRSDAGGSGGGGGSSAPQSGSTGVNVRPSDVEEPMYEQYRDGTF